jgi:hypothetical protein
VAAWLGQDPIVAAMLSSWIIGVKVSISEVSPICLPACVSEVLSL